MRSNRSTLGWALTSAKRATEKAADDHLPQDHVAGLPKKVCTACLDLIPQHSWALVARARVKVFSPDESCARTSARRVWRCVFEQIQAMRRRDG